MTPKYKLLFTELAERQLKCWRQSGQKKTCKKLADLLEELTLHPETGSGHVEPLKGNMQGLWSRKITKGDRLIYSIEEDRVVVVVISMKGHYGDK